MHDLAEGALPNIQSRRSPSPPHTPPLACRSGNYEVVASNHTLVLNWNSQTVPLLRQIAINKMERAPGIYQG